WSFKVLVEVVLTPATYAVVGWLKRREHEDYYDVDTNFTPFSLGD
ncbi:MAG TPA: VUT family protein, partial [Gammaproteobacteria bacterium]|nr:VUT family protein [Gammaproteobacteria bacterium]